MTPSEALLAELVERRVVVCCGSGGVGKTTTAAVLAMEAARQGRRSVVVTIDPARRLADALGLKALSNTPATIAGPWPGELAALMLDTEGTFNGLVAKYAGSIEQAEKIMSNRFYRNIAGALSGTQEYMASEKLYELYEETDFDLIVVDTPPTRNALDFLEAPSQLTRFLDHRLYRIVTAPTRGLVKAVNFAAQGFLRSIGKVVGGEVVADAIAFFAAFEGMDEGFKLRAARVDELLHSSDCGFVLVTSPRADAVLEAAYFADRLEEGGLDVRGLIVNRMHPIFDDASTADELSTLVDGLELRNDSTPPATRDLADHVEVLLQLRALSAAEQEFLGDITERIQPAPVCRVPMLDVEVHDLDSLAAFADQLFDRT